MLDVLCAFGAYAETITAWSTSNTFTFSRWDDANAKWKFGIIDFTTRLKALWVTNALNRSEDYMVLDRQFHLVGQNLLFFSGWAFKKTNIFQFKMITPPKVCEVPCNKHSCISWRGIWATWLWMRSLLLPWRFTGWRGDHRCFTRARDTRSDFHRKWSWFRENLTCFSTNTLRTHQHRSAVFRKVLRTYQSVRKSLRKRKWPQRKWFVHSNDEQDEQEEYLQQRDNTE